MTCRRQRNQWFIHGRFAMKRVALLAVLFFVFYPFPSRAEDDSTAGQWTLGGHLKVQGNLFRFPDDSAFHELVGSNSVAQSLIGRLNAGISRGPWDFAMSYQLVALHSDLLPAAGSVDGISPVAGDVISDDRRWWDLTHVSTHGDRSSIVSRFDRLYLGFTSEHMVWRFGRQAISWGNGLIFTPMDVFNPFDPAAVDKEYKTGDDMLYAQWLFASGADLQGIVSVRRNPETGQAASDESSLALKYHGFIGSNEFDLLLAEHYDDLLLGVGGIVSLGGAIWRGDLTLTKTERHSVISAVSSINRSWTWNGRNVTGLVEYYFTEFGQPDQKYALDDLQQNPDLLQRLERGELFTLGRHYLAASLTLELTPLLRVTPTMFVNLQDPSCLAQLVAQYDWKQDVALLTAINIPIGPDGSEYGGPESGADGKYLSGDASVFVQAAWYF